MSDPVQALLEKVSPAKRRRDAETLLELMARATGESPQVYYGTGIGYGHYHYKYKSGREGDAAAAGFAPRKAATVVYLMDGIGKYEEQLIQLGPHTSGVGCLYIKDLEQIDLSVLEAIVAESYRTLTADTYGLRARESSHGARDR